MSSREILMDQLGRPDLPDDLRERFSDTLLKQKSRMYSKEEELISVEDTLRECETFLEYAHPACNELEAKIRASEGTVEQSGHPGFCLDGFPWLKKLVYTSLSCLTRPKAPAAPRDISNQAEIRNDTEAAFGLFSSLPVEIRLMIWRAGLPGPRILTHDPTHNKRLALFSVSTESRQAAGKRYMRILSPDPHLLSVSSTLYTDPAIDTVVISLTCLLSGFTRASLFDLKAAAFDVGCFRLFTGLAKVKHLALAFELTEDNGEALFSPLPACCPNLETLILFPSTQMDKIWISCPQHWTTRCFCQDDIRFVEYDSNFIDYLSFRCGRYRDRAQGFRARCGSASLEELSYSAQRYGPVFSEYVEQHGGGWKPTIIISLLTQWNPIFQGWQLRRVPGDPPYRMRGGIASDRGDPYLDLGIVCVANGELLSRYDGIRELFAEEPLM